MTNIDPTKVHRGHPVYIYGPYNAAAELRRNRRDWSIVVGNHAKFGTQEEIFAAVAYFRHYGFIPKEDSMTTTTDITPSLAVISARAENWRILAERYHLAPDANVEAMELAIWQRGYAAGIMDVTDAISTVAKSTRAVRIVH